MKSPGRLDRAVRIALSGLLILPQAVAPATITVQGACTLPDAIRAANRDAAVAGCRAGAGADTIVLEADVSLTREDNPDNGLPQIDSEITVRGNDFRVERAANAPAFRIFDVTPDGDLTLENVTVANGSLGNAPGAGIRAYGNVTLENSTVSGNETNDRGGGIFAQESVYNYPRLEVTLINSTVSNNSAKRGAGITAYDYSRVTITGSTISENAARARGGGLLFVSAVGTITSSTIAGNTAASGAGLRAGFYSYVTLVDTTISGNDSRLEGGGIFANYSSVDLERSRVENNSAEQGGGVYFGTGYGGLYVSYSTISGNRATAAGGGAFMRALAGEVTINLRNTTVSGNSAPTGGGLYLYHVYYRNAATVTHSTISQNSATVGAGLYFQAEYADYHPLIDNVIAGNDGPNCSGDGFFDGGNNFDDDGTCGAAAAIVPGVDFDTELADNGGPTPTHALLSGSVAVDTSGDCGLSDQRGFERGSSCDSGAFELGVEELGAAMRGISHRKVICKNLTTRKARRSAITESSWLCGDLGLDAAPGERVRLTSTGIANGVIPAGGSISGLAGGAPAKVSCRNRTTGEKISFTPRSASWSCEDQGLTVNPGDSVRQKIRGRV